MSILKHSQLQYNHRHLFIIASCFLLLLLTGNASAQPVLQPWGNMTGIRIDGQLMEFESSIKVIGKDGSVNSTGKELQRPKYIRDSGRQVVSTNLGNLFFTEKIEAAGKGKATVDLQLVSRSDSSIEGTYFCIDISQDYYPNCVIKLSGGKEYPVNKLSAGIKDEYLREAANSISVLSKQHQVKISFNEKSIIVVKHIEGKDKNDFRIYLPVQIGDIKKYQAIHKLFAIETSDIIDRGPIHLQLNISNPGPVFAGFGGNFRIQNPVADPLVIDYCLNNMRVAWGRVEMPWRFWQPRKNVDPVAEARSGKLNPAVQKAAEMAQRLGKMNIPIILSAWFPPAWAVEGKLNFRHLPGGEWGNALNKDSLADIYKSIADYIIYLKENYGTDIALFSFNESDLGINVRQTGQEHAELIKGLGAYFVKRGLKTKMLLGDNSDATTYEFIYPAMKDSVARQYIGAVSFHSWRGWEKSLLEKWAEAATRLKVPLIVAEGSIDAAAWNYPAIFEEPVYSMEEINLYIRLLTICRPLTILQWQLTSDYSPLSGGGIFGSNVPLHPTRRFWNLKQLASTPNNLNAMSITCDRPSVSCAAMGNNTTHTYAIHLVNNGAARKVTLKGLPKEIKQLKIFVTDQDHSMKEGTILKITAGQVDFDLPADSYTTLNSQ